MSQNSKFLQFVSKMSRGELIIDDNQVKPAPGDWASEFQQQYNSGPSWADEYVSNWPKHYPKANKVMFDHLVPNEIILKF